MPTSDTSVRFRRERRRLTKTQRTRLDTAMDRFKDDLARWKLGGAVDFVPGFESRG